MTQPSVLDSASTFPPSSLLFPARASPIVCATDAVEVLLHLAIELFNGASLSTACTRICLRRHQARHFGSSVSTSDQDGMKKSTIRQHPIASAVVFLASLTQAVKVFGFEGIKWAQVIAAFYLGSYLVLAAVQVLAQDENAPALPDLDSPAWTTSKQRTFFQLQVMTLGLASSIASFVMCSWVVYKLCADGKGEFNTIAIYASHNSLSGTFLVFSMIAVTCIHMVFALVAFAVIMGPLAWIFLIIREALLGTRRLPGVDRVLTTLFGFLWSGLALYLYLKWVTTYQITGHGVFGGTIAGAGVLVFGLICVELAIFLVVMVFGRKRRRVLSSKLVAAGFLMLLFSLMHLVVACLYFGYVFDPKGTAKPAWTEKLG